MLKGIGKGRDSHYISHREPYPNKLEQQEGCIASLEAEPAGLRHKGIRLWMNLSLALCAIICSHTLASVSWLFSLAAAQACHLTLRALMDQQPRVCLVPISEAAIDFIDTDRSDVSPFPVLVCDQSLECTDQLNLNHMLCLWKVTEHAKNRLVSHRHVATGRRRKRETKI